MKQFEFTEKYDQYKKGDKLNMKKELYHTLIHPLLMRGVLKVIRSDKVIRDTVIEEATAIKNFEDKADTVIVPKTADELQNLREKLESKKMQFLRNFGHRYNAYDTKKSELVAEILEKAPLNDIKSFVGE